MVTTARQKVLTPGVPATLARAAQNDVMALNSKCVLTAAKYNDAAMTTGGDARKSFDAAEVARDRATLESLFAEEYNFVDPFGVISTRDQTINTILAGNVRKDSFRTTAEALQIHDNGRTIVSTGKFAMEGKAKVRFKTGTVRDKDISGTYHSTHTYVKRDGRLQLASSHLTQDPAADDKVEFVTPKP